MKPLQLYIKGLNSFEEEQAIDFNSLMPFGMFGVFGPTGSGKSSIFDAMTLALYGAMPRHGKDSLRESLNAYSKEMSVRLRFELLGAVYSAERSYVKRKDKFEPRARLYKELSDTVEVITDKPAHMTHAVTELIGLSYSDFSRAVVLPQGKFAEFLLLENREKRDMLERIFGLEGYGETLNRRINDARKEQALRLEILDNSLMQYEGINAERLAEERTAQAAAETRQWALKAQSAEQTAVVKEFEEFGRLLSERSKYLTLHELCHEQANEHSDRIAKLAQAQAADVVGPYIVDYRRATAELSSCDNALKEKKIALAQVEEEEKNTVKAYESAQALKDTEYIVLVSRETNLVQALRLQTERHGIAEEHKRLRSEYRETHNTLGRRRAAHAELLAASDKDTQELAEIRRRRKEVFVSSEYRGRVQAAYSAAQERNTLGKRIKTAENTVSRLRRRLADEQAKHTELLNKAEVSTALVAGAERELENARQRDMAYTLAQGLMPDQACPVCGSSEHPLPAKVSTSDEEAAAQLSELGTRLAALRVEADEHRLAAARLAAGAVKDKDACSEHEAELTELLSAREEVDARLVAYSIEDAECEVKLLADRDAVREELEKKESMYQTAQEARRRDIDSAVVEINSLETLLSALEAAGREKRAAIDRLLTSIEELTGGCCLPDAGNLPAEKRATGESGLLDENRLQELLSEVRRRAKKIQSSLDTAKTALERITERKRELSDASGMLEARIAAVVTQRDTLLSTIDRLLQEHGYGSMDEVMMLPKTEQERLSEDVRQYERRLAACEDNLIRLDTAIEPYIKKGLSIEGMPGRMAEERLKLESLLSSAEAAAQEAAVLKERVAKTEEGLLAAEQIKKERGVASRRADLLTELSKLFVGNQFVEYVARRQMHYITTEASARLKIMTAGRYALELAETERADFVIRDDHNGGIRRSPRTLSGGETFIVSLCLALALSSKIQLKGRARLAFFFLDEGFGSLDPAALDTVISALERLRQESMAVGVITHVDELKSRMPVKLMVTPAKPGVCGTKVKLEL